MEHERIYVVAGYKDYEDGDWTLYTSFSKWDAEKYFNDFNLENSEFDGVSVGSFPLNTDLYYRDNRLFFYQNIDWKRHDVTKAQYYAAQWGGN